MVIRIAGVNIPENKQIFVALLSIYGIGKKRSLKICKISKVEVFRKVSELSTEQINNIRNLVLKFITEGNLRKEISLNIKRLIDIGSYRGIRHIKKLPVRGQRTRTNAKTRKRLKKTSNKK
ncbi:MAG: 30S ribosomal protein S13 [Enterobacteriaceae bacterium]